MQAAIALIQHQTVLLTFKSYKMKKLNRILFGVISLLIFSWIGSRAQIAMNNPHHSVIAEDARFFSPNTLSASLYRKAEKNFNKIYQQAFDMDWSSLEGNTLLCRFSMQGIFYRAFYTVGGKWLYTVSSYDAAHLNKDVYDEVKKVYYNSNIVFVNQIDQENAETIYIVEVQDEKSIKKVRVQGDEFLVISEFTK
jgi:hypothetical protein